MSKTITLTVEEAEDLIYTLCECAALLSPNEWQEFIGHHVERLQSKLAKGTSEPSELLSASHEQAECERHGPDDPCWKYSGKRRG